MQVLIVGGGGREHALVWKAGRSPRVNRVYVAPGNAGTASEPGIENVNIAADDIAGLIDFAAKTRIHLTIVGPEDPLVKGIADEFTQSGLKCLGPGRQATRLEGSKTFAKAFLTRHSIPTVRDHSFAEITSALEYLDRAGWPVVIKADGLAPGKGVIIPHTLAQAKTAVTDMLCGNRFGQAGQRVVIEEYLHGEEASFICMVDGHNILALASSRDYKAAYNEDAGPNTGGMGAFSPAPVISQSMHDTIMQPTVAGLVREEMLYIGFLYAGLIIGRDGILKVLEYNCRLGGPETQPVMMRLQSDIVGLCLAALDGRLDRQSAVWDGRVALGVVMVAHGYPGSYKNGQAITGLVRTAPGSDCDTQSKLFHAGTRIAGDNIVTSGGRVLCATALGVNIKEARKRAYALAESVHWEGGRYRDDIGLGAIKPQ